MSDHTSHYASRITVIVLAAFGMTLATACAADLGSGLAGVPENWESECTYCHGGLDNQTGAPPYGLFGETSATNPAVGAHTAHVGASETHAPVSCEACHPVPSGIDETTHINAKVDVVLSSAAGTSASFDKETRSCSAVACHGNGKVGAVGVTPAWDEVSAVGCTLCHGYKTDFRELGGEHATHKNLNCAVCHGATMNDSNAFVDKAKHGDGVVDILILNSESAWNAAEKTCAVSCHGGSAIHWYED